MTRQSVRPMLSAPRDGPARSGRLHRRTFVRLIGLGAGASLLAACAQAPAPPAPAAPAKPAESAAKPTEGVSKAAAAPTQVAGGTPKRGGTLRYAMASNPADLDPHTTGATNSWHVLEQVYERLTMLDKDQKIVPWLAESWEVAPDGLIYTFKLRSNVKFHNGRLMTAADVQSSFERIRDPKTPSVAKPYFADVTAIEAPDDRTVRLKLAKPFAAFLYAVARLETAVVPKEEVEKQNNSVQEPVGSGPFKFVEFKKDVNLVLERNPDYWKTGLPYLDRVVYRPITDSDVRLTNLRTGEVDVIQDVPAKDIESLQTETKIRVGRVGGVAWPHLSMNTRRPPFDNVKVRQAIHYALDRKAIMDLVSFGHGTLSETPLPPGNPFRSEIAEWKTDRAKAKQLLAEAGHPNGFSTTMRVITGSNAALAEVAQAQLKEVGINVAVEKLEATTWFKDVFSGHSFDMSIVAHLSKIDPDISLWDILHKDGPKNYTGTNIPELNALLDEGRTTLDEEKRKGIYAKAQQIVVEQSGYVVLYLPPFQYGWSNAVQNGEILPFGDIRFWEVWLS
jgi:peptide/nickel transport system substrate-binding protein